MTTPPHDWATSRAIDIIGAAHRMPFTDALTLTANMLRIAHAEGFNAGVESSRDIFNRALNEAIANQKEEKNAGPPKGDT